MKDLDKNKRLLLFIILMIIVIIIILCFTFKDKKKAISKISKEEYINNVVTNVFYNKNVTIDKLESIMDVKLIKNDIFIGKDSELRYRPANNIIKKYKLNKYITLQDELANEVETRAINNIEYRIVDKNDIVNYIEYEIKPWYFYKYLWDVEYLKELIMNDDGFKVDSNNVFNEKYELNSFKARVVALRILKNHLSDYDNVSNERFNFKFYFNSDKEKEFQFYSLYFNLQGATSEESPDRMTIEQINIEKEKMKKYMSEAETKGLYNKNDPYKI